MKKAIFLSILVIVLITLSAKAQIIEGKLSSNVDSTQILVLKGRKMIIDQLNEKEYSTIREISHYLEDKTLDKENTPFDYTEYLYLNLLLEDWDALTDYMRDYMESEHIVPYLVNDQLKPLLIDRVVTLSDTLLIKSQNADMDEDSKSVINLFIHLIKNDTPDPKYYSLLNAHNKKFNNSVYKDFITSYLPAPQVKQAYSFSIGSGMVFPLGKLAESFSQRASFYASMDINYKSFFGAFYAQAAGLKLEVPFTLTIEDEETDYLKGDIFNYQDFGVKGGYFLVRSNRFHLGPYATLDCILLKTTDYDFWERLSQKVEDDENWEYKIINSFCFGGGMHTELKIYESHRKNKRPGFTDRYISVKADAGYNYITDHDIQLFKGNTWYYTIALVFGEGIF